MKNRTIRRNKEKELKEAIEEVTKDMLIKVRAILDENNRKWQEEATRLDGENLELLERSILLEARVKVLEDSHSEEAHRMRMEGL